MPDAGDFERDSDQHGTRMGWGEAFAALPQETPDAGGWQRVQARLPAPALARARWPLWLATAASLLLAVAIPLRMLPLVEPESPTPMPRASAATATATGSDDAATITVAPPSPAIAARQPEAATQVVHRDTSHRARPSQRPLHAAANSGGATPTATAKATPELEPLYAQSAQLESLLVLARDERVASGTSAALSGELNARVAAIDAALSQSGLEPQRRADLWGQRVDALQRLVGIEVTNRLYAARGQSYDAALVSID